jgi:N-acetylmuramoyl-L-alanine amidase
VPGDRGSPAPEAASDEQGPVAWPPITDDGTARAVVTPTGVVVPVDADLGGGRYRVTTPCNGSAEVTGTALGGATVVLDPGHGGDELGALGPDGLREKDVNLAVAEEAQDILEARGATVVLTRTADYRITLASRAGIAKALQPVAFVSVHHNSEPDGPTPGPGTETYYQVANPQSRRLAGLVWEAEVAAFAPLGEDWVGDRDHGAKTRLTGRGGDYYGILARTAGLAAVLSEGLFISEAAEEALLADSDVRRAEAQAIADAVVRFVTTDEPGSGFTDAYPRTDPAGPGGGAGGCVDPPL